MDPEWSMRTLGRLYEEKVVSSHGPYGPWSGFLKMAQTFLPPKGLLRTAVAGSWRVHD
ncbi:hypothetical protein CRG98_027016 [Punica granatum]|uniref:Uncharacterized protein n=1 Tax=Punica granatum TaxID=22663 RepID=A0A2I0J8M8_PUNGR|nr:hypothetical protein CRG98_027016 [Punica granatum]